MIINYQPINHFLADDKFPIPNKVSLFQHLSYVRIFSKFYLKVRFGKVGIDPTERAKKHSAFLTTDQ